MRQDQSGGLYMDSTGLLSILRDDLKKTFITQVAADNILNSKVTFMALQIALEK